jgi:hypothetical protein
MKTAIMLLLFCSLGANVWLWARRQAAPPHAAAVAPKPAAAIEPSLPIAALEAADPAELRAALQRAGADEATTRAVLEGVLRRRQREKLAALRSARLRHGWWRDGRSALAADTRAAKAIGLDALAGLLGRDPRDIADAEARYLFLPPEKRRRLALIDLDYAELGIGRSLQSVASDATRTEAEQQRLLIDERRRDVFAALTPEERAEYELRFSGVAGLLARRLDAMNGTEADYRALKPLLEDFQARAGALPRGDPAFGARYAELQQQAAEQLAAAVGYDHARQYLWAGYQNDYAPLRRAAEAAQLPPETPVRVMELAEEVGRAAAKIHDDPAVPAEQKRAALLALQQHTQASLDALLPISAQQTLPADGLRWLKELSSGRYYELTPSVSGSGSYSVFTISDPPPAKRAASALLLPPAGGR